jgi:antitoxin PrlF
MENKEVFISSVTEKGQTTIPSAIRKEFGIKAGDKVAFEVYQGRITVKKIGPL